MSSNEWSALPPGTTPAMHKPLHSPSGWQAEQDALRAVAEREAYDQKVFGGGIASRVVR